MRPLLYFSILLLAACANNSIRTNPQDSLKRESSVPVTNQTEQPGPKSYMPIQSSDQGNFHISIQAVFHGLQTQVSRDSLVSNILVFYNKVTRKGDTLDLGTLCMPGDTDCTNYTDVTRDIRFEKPAVVIGWRGDSDWWQEELVGFINDTLKVIYEGYVDSLKRKDKWTLTGLTSGTEEITGQRFYNAPLTISLRTLESKQVIPDTLFPSFATQAQDTIHAWRVLKTGEFTPYTIRPGRKLTIDTVLPAGQTVIMHIDSLILRTTSDNIYGKILLNSAG